jgi:hypothetical protein
MTTTTSIEAGIGCPPPPRMIRAAGEQLQVARTGTKEQIKALGPLEKLPRPWLPHTCHPRLLGVLLLWLDDVAAWLNHDYTWRMARPIPDCWPEHPHIVHELAVLAWLRLLAEESLEVGPIEEWHRYALPSFLSRLTDRLGAGCSSKHDNWPGLPRHTTYHSADAVHARQQAFNALVQEQERLAERRRLAEPEQLELDTESHTEAGPEPDERWGHEGGPE